MNIDFNSRRKDRRGCFSYIEKDRRREERRGRAQGDIEKKRRKEFNRHLKAQR